DRIAFAAGYLPGSVPSPLEGSRFPSYLACQVPGGAPLTLPGATPDEVPLAHRQLPMLCAEGRGAAAGRGPTRRAAGTKLACVPFLSITAALDPAVKRRVLRGMLVTAATVALALIVLGELLRALLHFTIGSLSIAGGVILLVLAVGMVLGQGGNGHATAGK